MYVDIIHKVTSVWGVGKKIYDFKFFPFIESAAILTLCIL